MKIAWLVALLAVGTICCPAAQSSTYRVRLDTSKGPVVIQVDRNLAPNGAKRFYALVKAHYFDGARFYRVVPGFVVQWGGAADPAVSKKWGTTSADDPAVSKKWARLIPNDPVKLSNTRGTVAFAATNEPNTRTTHMFINLGN